MQSNILPILCNGIKLNNLNSRSTFTIMFSYKSVVILDILLKEGFIRGFFIENKNDKKFIVVLLKKLNLKSPALNIKRNKNLKNRFYTSYTKLREEFSSFNLPILSNKNGMMTGLEAINMKLGGIKIISIN